MILSTPRLELRPLRTEDAEPVRALWTSAHVRRFLFDDRELSEGEVHSFIAASETNFREVRYGIWLAFEESTLVGFAGFLRGEGPPSLVYGVRLENAGRGLATEAAAAVLAYAVQTLRLEQIVADVDEPNTASVRVLEKLGMKPVGRAIVHGRPLLNFSWRA